MVRLFLSAVLLTGLAYAETNYESCHFPFGMSVSPAGVVSFDEVATVGNVSTQGLVTTYQVSVPWMGHNGVMTQRQSTYTVTKDGQGRIVSVRVQGSPASQRDLRLYRRSNAQMMAALQVPQANPHLTVPDGQGGFTIKPVDDLTGQDLARLGITDVSSQDLRQMRRSHRRDVRLSRRLARIYERINARGPVWNLVGSQARYDYSGENCRVAQIANLMQNDENITEVPYYDASHCGEILRLYESQSATIEQCHSAANELAPQYAALMQQGPLAQSMQAMAQPSSLLDRARMASVYQIGSGQPGFGPYGMGGMGYGGFPGGSSLELLRQQREMCRAHAPAAIPVSGNGAAVSQ